MFYQRDIGPIPIGLTAPVTGSSGPTGPTKDFYPTLQGSYVQYTKYSVVRLQPRNSEPDECQFAYEQEVEQIFLYGILRC